MSNSWYALFFIAFLLFSSIFVNGVTLTPVLALPNPQLSQICDSCGVMMESQFKPSPLYQFKLGIPVSKVTCRVGFDLVIKKSDNSPACVKPDTAQKLVERGWGMWNIKTAWFEFKGGIDCQKIPWIRELVKSNDTSTLIQSMENGTLVREYFQSHGITLLQMKSFVSAVSNPNSVCGYGTFFFLVPQNDTSKMVELSYQVPTDAQQYDIR